MRRRNASVTRSTRCRWTMRWCRECGSAVVLDRIDQLIRLLHAELRATRTLLARRRGSSVEGPSGDRPDDCSSALRRPSAAMRPRWTMGTAPSPWRPPTGAVRRTFLDTRLEAPLVIGLEIDGCGRWGGGVTEGPSYLTGSVPLAGALHASSESSHIGAVESPRRPRTCRRAGSGQR